MAITPQPQGQPGSLESLADLLPQASSAAPPSPSLNGLESLGYLLPEQDPIPAAARKVGVGKIQKKKLYEDALDTAYPENVLRNPVNFLSQFKALDSVDLNGMAPSTQASAAKFFHHLSQKGLKPKIESGRRYGAGKSYHDHGEALDINIYDAKGNYLSPSMFEEVKHLAAETGFRGIINETDPKILAQTGGSGPHIHLAMGPEANFGPDLATLRKGKRSKPNPAYISKQPKAGDNSVSEDYVHSIAKAHGWDDPNDLVRQLKAESGLRAKDDSGGILASRGADGEQIAFGIAQFTPATLEAVGPKYGISPEEYYRNPAAQVRLGSLYMLDLVKQHGGSKAKALYEYNAGGPALDNFLNGRANMPEETRNYIAKILQVDPGMVDNIVKTGKGDKIFNPTLHQQRFEEDKRSVQEEAFDFLKLWGKGIKDNYWDQGAIVSPDQIDVFKEVLSGFTFGISELFTGRAERFDSLRANASMGERMALGLPWFLSNVFTTEFLAGKMGATTLLTGPGESIAPGSLASGVDKVLDFTKHLVPEAGAGGLKPFARLFMGSTPDYAKAILTYAGVTGANVATESAVRHIQQGTPMREAIPSIIADGIGGTMMGTLLGFGIPAAISGAGLVAGELGIMGGKAGPIIQGVGNYLYGPAADGAQRAAQVGARFFAGAGLGAAAVDMVYNPLTGQDVDPWVGAAGGAALASLGPQVASMLKKVPFLSQEEARAAAQAEQGNAGAVLDALDPRARSGLTGHISKWWNGLKEYNKQILEGTVTDQTGKYFKVQQSIQRMNALEETTKQAARTEEKYLQIGAQQSQMIQKAESEIGEITQLKQSYMDEINNIPGAGMMLEYEKIIKEKMQQMASAPQEQQPIIKQYLDQAMKNRDALEKSIQTSYKNQQIKLPGEIDPVQHIRQIESRLAQASERETQWKQQWGPNGEQLQDLKGNLGASTALARHWNETVQHFNKPEVRDEFLTVDTKRLAEDAEYRAQLAERVQSQIKEIPVVNRSGAISDHEQQFLQDYKESITNKVLRSFGGQPVLMREVEDRINQSVRTMYDPNKQLSRLVEDQRARLEKAVQLSSQGEKFTFQNKRPDDAIVRVNWENRGNLLDKRRQDVYHVDPATLSKTLKVTPELLGISKEEMEQHVVKLLGKAEAGEVLKFPKLTIKKGKLAFRKPQDGFIDDTFRDEILSIEVANRMGDTAIPIRIPKTPKSAELAKGALEETFDKTGHNAVAEAAYQYRLLNEYMNTMKEASLPSVPGILQGTDDVFDASQGAVIKRLLKKHLSADKDGNLSGTTPLGKQILEKMESGSVKVDPDTIQKELQSALFKGPDFNGFSESYNLIKNSITPDQYKQVVQNELAQIGMLLEDRNSPASLLGKLLKDPSEIFRQPVKTVENLRQLIQQSDYNIMSLAQDNIRQIRADNGMSWNGIFGYAKNMIPALLMNRKQSINLMAAGVVDKAKEFKLNKDQLGLLRKALDDPRHMGKAIADPDVKKAMGYYMDILGQIQKQEAHRPELIPAAERIYLLRKYPGLMYYAQRLEGNLYSRTDLINKLGVYSKDPNQLFEKILSSGPLRYDASKGELVSSKNSKEVFGKFSADTIHEGQASGALLRSKKGPVKEDADIDELADKVRKGVLAPGKDSVDRFMALDPNRESDHAQLIKLSQMDEAYRESPERAVERWKDMQALFLMENGLKDPYELLGNRLSSVFDAHSEQDMLRHFSDLMITGKPGANEVPQYALEVRESGSPPQTYARYRGTKTKINKGLEGFVSPKYETSVVEYEPLSKIFGKDYHYIDATGKAIPGDKVYLHPDLVHYIDQYAMTKPSSQKGMFVDKFRDLIRHFALVGGPMPHALNTASNIMIQHAMNPLRAFGLMSQGERMMMHEDRYFLMANAIRHGLNPKVSHAMTQAISEQIFSMADPEARNILSHGPTLVPADIKEIQDAAKSSYSPPYPQSIWMRMMKAMDVGPEAPMARQSLPDHMKFFADFFGMAPKVDAMMARAMIVEPMQQAQLAAFYNHSVEIMQRAMTQNPGVSKEMLWKQAQEAASIKVNQMSGALPYYFTSQGLREQANNWLLTPNWAMGKAQAILGALEPVLGLVDKSMGRNTMFGHLAEPIRQDLYKQYASALAVGTMSFLGATQVMNFLMNGSFSLQSENSKDWFRVKIGDHMWSNPLFGFYREFARSIGGVIGENSIEPVLENLTRNLIPGVSGLAATAQNAAIQPSGIGGQLGDIADNITSQMMNTEEVFGGGDIKHLGDIFGLRLHESEGDKLVPGVRKRGKEWALRLMGVYRSDYNTPTIIERRYQQEQLYWMNQTKDEVGQLIQAGLDQTDPEKCREFIGRAFEKGVLRGVKTSGKFAAFQTEKTGSPYLTMSFEQFMNVLNRKADPIMYGVDVMSNKKGPIVAHMIRELDRVNKSWDDAIRSEFEFSPVNLGAETELQRAQLLGE